jgi:C-terminal processing protease CtpA/Prc
VITRTGIRDYTAEPDALYPELKLGVLVGRGTRGTVEWLAAALQSNQRAIVFGEL